MAAQKIEITVTLKLTRTEGPRISREDVCEFIGDEIPVEVWLQGSEHDEETCLIVEVVKAE